MGINYNVMCGGYFDPLANNGCAPIHWECAHINSIF